MIARMRALLRRTRLARRARAELRRILADPARIAGTSLRPAHAGRADLVHFEERDGVLTRLEFTLLRHPRPYPFSTQHHLVAEVWGIELPGGRPERLRGLNISGLEGEDGRPSGS
jgi:hypothetical protein